MIVRNLKNKVFFYNFLKTLIKINQEKTTIHYGCSCAEYFKFIVVQSQETLHSWLIGTLNTETILNGSYTLSFRTENIDNFSKNEKIVLKYEIENTKKKFIINVVPTNAVTLK